METVKLRLCDRFYHGEKHPSASREIIRNIRKGKFQPGPYVIALAENPEDQLDLIPVYTLKGALYRNRELFVVGAAENKEEAVKIAQKMIMDACGETGSANVRQMFGKERFRK